MRRSDHSELLCGIDPDCSQCSSCYQSLSPEDREVREKANEGVLIGEIVRRVMDRLGQSTAWGGAHSAQEPEALERCPVGISAGETFLTASQTGPFPPQ